MNHPILSLRGLRIVCVLAAGLMTASLASAAQAPARPNILWILGDDLGTELGCYGNPDARTPNLDRLAADGVRFSRFYTTAPVCSAARSAFMTGMYAQTISAHQHRTAQPDKKPLPEGVKLLTHWFRDAGYQTGNLAEFPAAMGLKTGGKTDWNFLFPAPAFDTRRWADLAGKQPYYAQINFQEPHRDFHAPPQTDPAKVTLPPFYPDLPVVRADWAAYLDSVAELDRKVGVVLKQLEAEGMADNTIVVFFGDNGRCHIRDKQFCYEEGLHVPLMIRWPKNFPAPAGFKAGTVDDRLLVAIDLAPTMLALAGAPVPAKMQGRVFLGAAKAPAREYAFGGRDRCDTTELTLRTVRDARYRYIRNLTPEKSLMSPSAYKEKQYPVWNLFKELYAAGKLNPAQALFAAPTAPAEELYDLDRDPGQLVNLAGQPAHRATQDRLRAALAGWRSEIGERGP
ncbi:MAG: sulfatase [Verrucomicrobia bacterium]|nr:sulfatase [Verrucomicrobiota bacterium]